MLLDSAGSLAEAIADNAIETAQRLSLHSATSAGLSMASIVKSLKIATTWSESDALPALPRGHRLPTHLDAFR